MLEDIKKDFQRLKNPTKAAFLQQFFKTGKGEYAEGDTFLGVMVPQSRALAKKYKDMSLKEVQQLLRSDIHEHRLVALFILVSQFKRGDEKVRERIIRVYLSNTKYINNWDLVDSSAPYILGEYLIDKEDRTLLDRLAISKSLWKQRIAILGTYAFIKKSQFQDTFRIAAMLLSHEHDLIHKAIGWMLREVGNRDLALEEKFLEEHYKRMPRTALRYAIEKFPERKRKAYLTGAI